MDRGNFLPEERKFLGKIVFFWNPAVDRYLSLVRACDCSHHEPAIATHILPSLGLIALPDGYKRTRGDWDIAVDLCE